MFETECNICGAPGGEVVIRKESEITNWTGDTLRGYHEDGWGMPECVRIIQKTGLCELCHMARRTK